ncbi:SusD/RagB family nutrient-binding outer membrane lipoprotein [Pseudoflavitalea sp. X16]|uniref:SusD/RagB family nutrient-binding outer membrane lipoprotein n=1 Tax=Paraflavitalea devenefica TaxID=2716334 RepID=UPI001421EC0B|nr:SusD/RagB family nutrient-binding outer membrane lipoprotein [Paraflavitalea devenefica]NII29435.1 SusD/RagB family nutrient-binding outer membrane lipoprotein [Paraflavitalea devenefica]
MKLYKCLSALALAAGIAGAGCKKFIDVNNNPNLATATNPTLVFTNALNVYAASLAGGGNVLGNYWGGYWAHSTSFASGTPEKTYSFTNGDFNYWAGILDNINDLQLVINTADAKEQSYLKGPAKVIKALRYQELTDVYGNVPYTDALKGIAVFQPKYDKAQDVYDSLIVLLDQAVADLKANPFPGAFQAGIYSIGSGHEAADWIKFANTVKLRILMRQSLARENYVKTEIQKILTEGSGFIGAGDDVLSQPGYTKTVGKLNPFYAAAGYDQNDAEVGGHQAFRISEYLIDTLKATNDTIRLKYIADVTPASRPATAPAFYQGSVDDYIGVPFGGEGADYLSANSSPVGPGRIIKGVAAAPQVIFTAAESLFLQAEAAQRLGIAGLGDAKTFYEQGIRESFRLLNAPADAANDLIAESASFNTAPDKTNAIVYQKWVALANFNGMEAWAEFRRNDFPAVPLSVNGGRTVNTRPVRLHYPLDEVNTNKTNVDAQGKIDVFTSRLFWDIR